MDSWSIPWGKTIYYPAYKLRNLNFELDTPDNTSFYLSTNPDVRYPGTIKYSPNQNNTTENGEI